MTPEIKQRWIKVLRNPKTKQTTGRLRNSQGGRCCLGVLSDICGVKSESRVTRGTDGPCTFIFYHFEDGSKISVPPEGFAGLSGPEIGKLVDLNDRGIPFPAIADWIEKNIVTDPT